MRQWYYVTARKGPSGAFYTRVHGEGVRLGRTMILWASGKRPNKEQRQAAEFVELTDVQTLLLHSDKHHDDSKSTAVWNESNILPPFVCATLGLNYFFKSEVLLIQSRTCPTSLNLACLIPRDVRP